MTWTDEIERAIVDDYLQLAQCFPANDHGLEHFRALWLKSVTTQLTAQATESATASSAVPRPYDHFLGEYLVDHERGAGPPGSRRRRARSGSRSDRRADVAVLVAMIKDGRGCPLAHRAQPT